MRRIWRISLISLLLLGGTGLLALEYVNRVVVPVKLRGWAESVATEALGRKLTIGRVRLHFWRGLVLEQISVQEDARYGGEPFFSAVQISGRVLYLPLLKDRRVVIPSIRLVQPKVRLVQDAEGVWNYSSLRFLQAPKSQGPAKFGVVVPKVVVEDGQLELAVKAQSKMVRLRFDDLDAQVGIGLPANVRWTVGASLNTTPPVRFTVAGGYELGPSQVGTTVESDVPLDAVLQFAPELLPPELEALGGTCRLEAQLSGPAKGPFRWECRYETRKLDWKAYGIRGSGDVAGAFSGEWPAPPAPSGDWPLGGVRGSVELKKIALASLPVVGELREIQGRVEITPEGAGTQLLSAVFPSGQKVAASGTVSSEAGLPFSAKLNATVPLNQIPLLPPKLEPAVKKWNLSGSALVDGIATGKLKPEPAWETDVTAQLQDAAFDLPGMGRVDQLAGSIRVKRDLLTVSRVRGRLQDRPVELEGTVVNFAQPEIDARLRWDPLAVEAQLGMLPDRLELQMVSGNYKELAFNLFGEVADWTGPAPAGNLYGEIAFQVEQLPSLFPKPPKGLAELPLSGPVSARWTAAGNLRDPKNLRLEVKASSPLLRYKKLEIEQAAVNLSHAPGAITLPAAKATIAGGTVTAAGQWDYREPAGTWTARIDAAEVALDELARQLEWKTPTLAGKLALDFEGTGQMGRPSTVLGKGSVRVSGGRIVELPFFGDFADLLQLPTLKTITFEEAEGPYAISGGAVRSEGFQIKATQATLVLVGSGGFLQGMDSPIEWKIVPTVSAELIPAESRSKIGRAIAKGTSYLVGELRVTGTWRNPKKIFVPKAVTQILNEQIFNLQDLLNDIF